MKKISNIFLLAVIIFAVAGCGGMHYNMDSHVKELRLAEASTNALKIYIEDYLFNDGPGSQLAISRRVAEGNIAPWIKHAIIEKMAATFVRKEEAEYKIMTKKVAFNAAMNGQTIIIDYELNGIPRSLSDLKQRLGHPALLP